MARQGALSPRLFYLLSSLRLRCGVNHRHHLPKHRAFRIGQFVDQRKVIAVAIGQQLDVEAARQAGVIIGLRLVFEALGFPLADVEQDLRRMRFRRQ
ncbi:hypothetical protein AZZ98_002059 [Serratia marcescens]|nr:hypothetical protein AZZ98_002059 [Serratia marcescens]